MNNPLRKILLGGAAVAALSAVVVAPANAYSVYPHPFFSEAECNYYAETHIIDSQTGAQCFKHDDGYWWIHVYN